MQTFQVRPFSNSIEAILVALSLTTLKSLTETQWNRGLGAFAPDLISLAIYGVLGVFTRPTFLAFTLPIAIEALVWTYRRASAATSGQPSRAFWVFWLRLVGLPMLLVLMYTQCFVFVDTLFFRGNIYDMVLTPLNFLRYNLSSDNLAEHGVHPRWLHLIVNLPLIVGPGLLYYGIRAARQLWRPTPTPLLSEKGEKPVEGGTVFRAPLYVIVSAVTILSAFRHQEPRFLVPLLVPFIALVAQDSQLQCLGRLFWVSWIISNMALAIVFGFLHQGGVVPSLIDLHDRLHDLNANAPPEFNSTLASVVYWKTYMPPWHLLAIQAEGKPAPCLACCANTNPRPDVTSGRYVLTDLAGASSETMLKHIVGTPAQETLVVAPLYAEYGLPQGKRDCFELVDSEFPHLDLDHLPEAMAQGWYDGMTLGIFTVDTTCLGSEDAAVQ
ncbi:hypothetical protein EVJ58_g5159 [Rhodofomes roseus]|uniref:Mannosyltransferase n=1 Tax=Rhodofomes roseus TaxID=34475 RepID=A0A4Y9YEK0_9APHY|nr:hypothetical protein EVJ58_g5159 [Rhodofomes roseus]